MDINRKTAFNTLLKIEKNNAYSNLELNSQINKEKPDSPALVRELTYGVLENKMYLDYLLAQLVNKGIKSLKAPTLTILRLGLYQVIFMNSVPDYAAVNESVKLARKYCHGQDGFVNAVMRNFLRKREELKKPEDEKDKAKCLSVKYSFEPWIIKLWIDQYGDEKAESLLKASNETRELTIRVNTLKTDIKTLEDSLRGKGLDVRTSDISHNILKITGSNVLDIDEYKSGEFSVQDEGSVVSTEILAPESGEVIYDVCAAPGGKSFSTAELMNNDGMIKSFDIYEKKLHVMDREAKRLGISIIETAMNDAAELNDKLIETADKVICDVPCSGLGVIRKKPEIKYKRLKDNGRELAELQLKILRISSKYVKAGGAIMYSTCTINDIENGQVVKTFLSNNTGFEIVEERQLLPDVDGTDGFYFCKMVRK